MFSLDELEHCRNNALLFVSQQPRCFIDLPFLSPLISMFQIKGENDVEIN